MVWSWRDQRKKQVRGHRGKKETGDFCKKQRVESLQLRFRKGTGRRQNRGANSPRSRHIGSFDFDMKTVRTEAQ